MEEEEEEVVLGLGKWRCISQRLFTSTCFLVLLVGRRRILWLPGDAVIHLCVAFTINRKREAGMGGMAEPYGGLGRTESGERRTEDGSRSGV